MQVKCYTTPGVILTLYFILVVFSLDPSRRHLLRRY